MANDPKPSIFQGEAHSMPLTRLPWMHRAGDHPTTDQEYFELLTRAVMSAGLGPRLVEVRWNGITAAFCDFDIEVVADMTPADSDRLMSDPGIIRNRRKIDATIGNAKTFLLLIEAKGSFQSYLDHILPREGTTRAQLQIASEELADQCQHLGLTSADLFLFACGYRSKEEYPRTSTPST
jgi:3-methyladenine DNA glycosylase Tag